MRQWINVGAVVFCLVLASCSGDKPRDLLETAEFEERQHNMVHAKQLYEDLVRLSRQPTAGNHAHAPRRSINRVKFTTPYPIALSHTLSF